MKYRLVLLLSVMAGLVFATSPNNSTNYENSYVYDPQAYLSNDVVSKVESSNKGTKVFVEIRDDFQGKTIEDYAKDMVNTNDKGTLGFANIVVSPKTSQFALHLSDNVRNSFGVNKIEKLNQALKDYINNKNYDGAILQVVSNTQQINSSLLVKLLSGNFDKFILAFVLVFSVLFSIAFIADILNGGRPF